MPVEHELTLFHSLIEEQSYFFALPGKRKEEEEEKNVGTWTYLIQSLF